MTKEEAINNLINTAKFYVGYQEKKSEDNLDDFNLNIGKANYTKFARDFFPELQGLEWCCMFVYACFAYTFNKIMATNLLCGIKTAKCSILEEQMRKKSHIETIPKKGDLVFFINSSSNICHIGIVIDINNSQISTIEGNTSNGNNTVIESGGCVCIKKYDLNNPRILYYGRPDWYLLESSVSKDAFQEKDGIVNATNVNIRMDAGINNPSIGTVTKNDKVKIIGEKYDMNGSKWYKINSVGYVKSNYISIDN